MKRAMPILFVSMLLATIADSARAGDWPRFRGPNGSGVSTDTKVPVTWSDSENLKWKTALPGPGSSSPIVVGDRVFVTCYSGYGVTRRDAGNLEDLKRHLLSIDRADGKIVWSKTIDAAMPEDPFSGMGVPEHGYASNTPVSDGERIYVFFGKSGALAFDMQGNQLWQTDLGRESSNRRWGSSASPILYKDTVIVNASEESQSVRALDTATGKEVWKAEAASLELAYNTPALVELEDGRVDVVIPVPHEIWGLNADTGRLTWFAETQLAGNVAPSPIVHDGVVYVLGGYPRIGAVAIRAGGKDDVTKSHIAWTSTDASYITSPVFCDGNLYFVSDQGIALCVDAKSGETVYKERLPGGGGSGGGRGKPFYASVVLVGDKIYSVSRRNGTIVLAAKPEFEQLAHNKLGSDETDFNGSPAVSDGQMFLRSNRFLYCLAGEK